MFVKFSMLSKEKLIYFKINIPKMKLILYIIQQERSIVDTSENNSTEVIKSSIILNMEENQKSKLRFQNATMNLLMCRLVLDNIV